LAYRRGHYLLRRITIFRKGTFFATVDSNFEICSDDETAFPIVYILCLEDVFDPFNEGISSRIMQAHKQKAIVGSWGELPDVREV
jgi:hypothetical protein